MQSIKCFKIASKSLWLSLLKTAAPKSFLISFRSSAVDFVSLLGIAFFRLVRLLVRRAGATAQARLTDALTNADLGVSAKRACWQNQNKVFVSAPRRNNEGIGLIFSAN
jgi:hypothetical protein